MLNRFAYRHPSLVWGIVVACVAAWIGITGSAFAQSPTTDELKGWLQNPWVLLGFMALGTVLSMLKQWKQAQMDGSTATVTTYLSHFQELAITLGGNLIAFFLLVDSGNLNFVSAVSIGYVLNSVADLNPLGGRSTALRQ